MKFRYLAIALLGFTSMIGSAQENMTPEKLWSLRRVSPIGLSSDKKNFVYQVTIPNVKENKFERKFYQIPIGGGTPSEVSSDFVDRLTQKISPDGRWILTDKKVKVEKITAQDHYRDLDKSTGRLYIHLDYRHWDHFLNGDYNHPIMQSVQNPTQEIDILEGKPYHCPQEPHGGAEDYIWSPDGSKILYVTKEKYGTDYVNSTNTDIFEYDVRTKQTKNLTSGMMGYDTYPQFSSKGVFSWLSMAKDGNEADKNDLYVSLNNNRVNLTKNWDNTVLGYRWNEDGNSIFIIAPTDGTIQLFEVNPFDKNPKINQLTDGYFDISDVVGQKGNTLFVTKTDFNHASEIYTFDLKSKKLNQLTRENDATYNNIAQCKTEKRYVNTTDGKKMLVWVVYPPKFDKTKKYPTLLYCEGGPQSPLTQFYSFRWNLSLMASQGYIVVAPNRRGMPGHGVEWNAQISGDWGGQPMRDYLAAADDIAKEPYVDKDKMGAVGASYGGYSVMYLAGIHQNRFKTFITHCGIFNFQSMYGTTEEKFFNNNEMGGAYWLDNPVTKKSYSQFSPINFVNNWNRPILIIQGGKDYRVTEDQAFQAFTAAQQKGIKSKLLYFPDENHWVLQPQNGLFWQRTFFSWLEETLK